MYRPFFIYGDAATEPPETDPAPVECTECGETECACGDDEWDEGNALPEDGR